MRAAIQSAAVKLALAFAGAGLVIAALILLARAAWLGLDLWLGPVWAFAILGGAFLLIGGATLAVALRRREPPRPEAPPYAAFMVAFLEGLQAGRATRRR